MDESKKMYNLRKVFRRAITSSIGFFSMGYFLNVFNSSQTCVSNILGWGENQEILVAVMTAIGPFGALFGVLSSGYLTKYYGKRSLLIYSDVLTIFGSILSYIPNTFTFGIGRFIVGFTSGNFSTICSQYTSEFTPADIYSKVGFIGAISGIIGTFFGNLVCIGLPTSGCGPSNQYYVFTIFLVSGFSTAIQLFMLLKIFKKESPKWLIQKQQYELALHSYESIYNIEYAESEVGKIKNFKGEEEQNFKQNTQEDRFVELICCKKGKTKGMRLGVLIHTLNQFSGVPF